MDAIRDLSKSEAVALYEQIAELVEAVKSLTPTKSVLGIIHHGENLMTALETHLAKIDPLPVRTARKSQPVEVK